MQTEWEKCVAFHGHECGGLMIGYKAVLFARELLNLDKESFSADEELVCITENDACGVDAVQVLLGCSAGKGNLLYHLQGKHAFSFYKRKSGEAVRIVLKPLPEGITRGNSLAYYREKAPSELFDVKTPSLALPEEAIRFVSKACELCGEMTAENYLRLQEGKIVCSDCFKKYGRFV